MSDYLRGAVAGLALTLGCCSLAQAQTATEPQLTNAEITGASGDATNHFGDSPNNPGPIATDITADLTTPAVKKAIAKVADWQLARAEKYFNQQWTFGALYCGFLAASQSTGDLRYHDAMVAMSEGFHWGITLPGSGNPGDLTPPAGADAAGGGDQAAAPPPTPPANGRVAILNANSECLSQTYLDLYSQYKSDWIIEPTQRALDGQINIEGYPAGRGGGGDQGASSTTNPNHIIWWWCDALYMAPPAWAKLYKATDDIKYLNYLDHQWWITSKNLYDPDEHLFYRDATFIKKKESNGKKMFWSRGEGWVMGGLVRVLQIMPADYPTRDQFVTQFKDMAARIATLQGPDGLWRAGMLDPDYYGEPENSGSSFFVYAMAWGVNEGILDRAMFEPVIAKGWKGLISHVHADGRLDCIQQTGSGPAHFKTSSSYVYGVGAFLLAGREVNRLAITLQMQHRTIAAQ
ncbi:MAG: glycoside hydrolase family 88 protein [Tepidisphaeraceae bacterium]|jgi:rhamnogalacturonyl hydrolase YesR